MMWGQYDQFSWWWFLIMSLSMLAFWGLVAWLVVAIVRGSRPKPTSCSEAERILAERYARGDVDADEYHRRLDDLHTTGATGGRGS
jgi:putative membrane protein